MSQSEFYILGRETHASPGSLMLVSVLLMTAACDSNTGGSGLEIRSVSRAAAPTDTETMTMELEDTGTGPEADGGTGEDTGTGPGEDTGTGPDQDTGTGPGEDTGTGPGEDTGTGPGEDTGTGTGPSEDTGTGPGEDTDPGEDTGTGPDEDTGTGPGEDTGTVELFDTETAVDTDRPTDGVDTDTATLDEPVDGGVDGGADGGADTDGDSDIVVDSDSNGEDSEVEDTESEATVDTGEDTGPADTESPECEDGEMRCDGDMAQSCRDGGWSDYTDCGAINRECVLLAGLAECVSRDEEDTSTAETEDTDSPDGGADKVEGGACQCRQTGRVTDGTLFLLLTRLLNF